MTNEDIIAYTEVDNILNYIDKKYYNKVPRELVLFFKENALDNYMYYDNKFNLKISPLTQKIICYLNLEYFAEPEERERLIRKYEDMQAEINKKYDIQNILEQRKSKTTEKIENTQLIVRENWLQKVISRIKLWLKKY